MGNRLLLISGLATVLAACQTRSASFAADANAASSALTLGQPCSAEGDCTSGFCVDGVCCDTSCGGGVRDQLSCSNIYGAVPGLVDGTCTTISPGDFCGALTSVNPCTWRGSKVNGGGQCPNPPGTSTACFPCTSSQECDGAFPVCLTDACVACDGDFGSGTPAACPSTKPVCDNGQCGGCSGCGGQTPTCNQLTSTCVACNGDFGSGATLPCPTSGAPACLSTGACAQCSVDNTDACTGNTPACDTTTNICVGCNGDFASGTTRACPSFGAPWCQPAGSCGKCGSDPDCSGTDICNTTLGNCGAGCVDDAGCTSNRWCAGGVCTPKLPNDEPLPPIGPIDGTCTATNGARACTSGVCSTTDNRCGLPNGDACGPPSTDARCRSGDCHAADNRCGLPTGDPCVTQAQCRSLICSPSNTCGECRTDADCGAADSGLVCDDTDLRCKPGCRAISGNGCGTDRTCTSTDDRIGKCAQCLSDAECGDAVSGQVCDEERLCVSGCRGSGGNTCGDEAVCTSGDEAVGACLSVEGGGPSCASSGGDNVIFSTSLLALIAMAVTTRMFRRRHS